MTEAEKTETRAEIQKLLDERFGVGHGCSADISAMLRVTGDTTIRFAHHDGMYWDLKRAGGVIWLVGVE